MKKLFLVILLSFILVSTCFGCSPGALTVGSVENNATDDSATNAPTAKPTPTPLPILVPTEILASNQCIIKIYENGEFGYIGNLYSKSNFDFRQERSTEDSITLEMIDAGIPLILEDWEYGNYSNNGQKPKFAYVLKSELDQEAYDSQYNAQLEEIRSKYTSKQIDNITSIIDIQKTNYGNAYLVNTEKQQGIVFAEMNFINYDLMQSTYCFVVDPFKGVKITDVALGGKFLVGLTEQGTVMSSFLRSEEQNSVSINTTEWTDVVDVAAGYGHVIGLKKDGTVYACGDNGSRQCDVSEWTDIIAVEAVGNYSLGIKSDGTIVTTGKDQYFKFDVSTWTDIVKLEVGNGIIAGLRKDGSVVLSGELTYRDGLKWDTSRGPILKDIVSIDLVSNMSYNSALAVLNSKGEVYFINIYDFFMNYDEFNAGINDIAATGENTFAILKGEKIVYSSSNAKQSGWDNILKNENRYAVKPFEYNRVARITEDGSLKVNEVQNDKREGIFTYSSAIKQVCVFGASGDQFLLLAENGDAVFVEIADEYQGPMKFESTVLFSSVKEQSKVIKIYQNSVFCAYLDDKGVLHYPTFLQEKLMEELRYLDWENKVNWDREK